MERGRAVDPVAEREPGEHLLAPQQPRPAGVFRALCGALRIFSSVRYELKKKHIRRKKHRRRFSGTKKNQARINIGKEKSGRHFVKLQMCSAKNKTAKYNNAAAILRIPMIFLPQIIRKLKRGDAAARHCATALPCAPRAS